MAPMARARVPGYATIVRYLGCQSEQEPWSNENDVPLRWEKGVITNVKNDTYTVTGAPK